MSQQLSGNPSMLLPRLSQRWQSFAGPADIELSAPLIPGLEPPGRPPRVISPALPVVFPTVLYQVTDKLIDHCNRICWLSRIDIEHMPI